MANLTVTPMDRATARAITGWRYPPPYEGYTMLDDPAVVAAFLSRAERGYFQIRDGSGELLAFCCFGEEARVPGGDYHAPALDIGIGVRPDLTGRGDGMRYLGAVLAFGVAQFQPTQLRLTVASSNQRAIRLYTRAGFREVSRFLSPYGRQPFVVMGRPAHDQSGDGGVTRSTPA